MPTARQRLTPWAAFAVTVLVAVVFAYVMARPHADAAATPAVPGLLPGDLAPGFTLSDLDGKPVSLASLKGHVVVLDFWATWCPPCVEELPTVAKVSAGYADQGVRFYAINVSDAPGEIRAFLDRQKLSLPVLLGGADSVDVPLKYAADYIPLLVVIDADGKIVARENVRPDNAAKMLAGWIEKATKSGHPA